jgi:DNA-binding CsgD family transcriptional regulator
MAHLAGAWAAMASGNPHQAAGLAADAVALIPNGSYGSLLARAWVTAGRAQQTLGRKDALDMLRDAVRRFDVAGAVWRRDQVLDLLRNAGIGGRKVARIALGPAALTLREREIAQLAAQRMTAYEIAARLLISKRTVEGHLANVYAKLGVRSKLDLADRLEGM